MLPEIAVQKRKSAKVVLHFHFEVNLNLCFLYSVSAFIFVNEYSSCKPMHNGSGSLWCKSMAHNAIVTKESKGVSDSSTVLTAAGLHQMHRMC